MFDLTTRDIKYLQGVGPQRATMLNKELEIFSLHDLLYYFPYKYVDRSRLYYIHEIDGNMPYIQLKGQILSFETVGEGRQRRLVAHFSDGTGVVDLVWFQALGRRLCSACAILSWSSACCICNMSMCSLTKLATVPGMAAFLLPSMKPAHS